MREAGVRSPAVIVIGEVAREGLLLHVPLTAPAARTATPGPTTPRELIT